MQMIIMIAMLSVIFGLTGTYAFCKSGSMIEFFGGNKKTRKMRIIRSLISVVIGGCSAMMSRTISMVMLHHDIAEINGQNQFRILGRKDNTINTG